MPKKRHRSQCKKIKSKIPDVLVVEPSECDRWASNQLEDLVEACWLYSRPPPALYDREPAVTARRIEVTRHWISGEGEEPVYVRPKLTTCAEESDKSAPKMHEQRLSAPPKPMDRWERVRSVRKKSLA